MNVIMAGMARETQGYDSDSDRWAAVMARDAGADDSFVYAVATTGVYCRPSCPARLARRENVSFYRAPAEARAAGFRACKRCRPDDRGQAERRAAAVARACRMIENADEAPTLDQLATAVGMSRYHFHRVFKQIAGVTPKAYAAAHRRARVQAELGDAPSVTSAIYDAGYNAASRFYETAEATLGMSPSAWRKGGADKVIRFAVGECKLGSILVAATDRGLCAIQFGDDPQALIDDLHARFPRAEIIGGDDDFEQLVAKVVGFVEAPGASLDLPFDIAGTAFQQKVWQALTRIPVGQTVSYAEIATAIGAPRAVRAVAGACAANPLAVAIPCHRVVRTDGGLGGYRWGIERKQVLLAGEAA